MSNLFLLADRAPGLPIQWVCKSKIPLRRTGRSETELKQSSKTPEEVEYDDSRTDHQTGISAAW